jgi:hypothetical protein
VFRGSAAIAAGLLTKRQLDSERWRRLLRDVYADVSLAHDHVLLVRGASLLLPLGATITGRSAAHMWGGLALDTHDPVEVMSPTRFGPVRGLAVRRMQSPAECSTIHRGVPICTPVHAAWDIARTLPMFDAVEWIDALARRRRLGRSDLIAHCGVHAVARARCEATLSLADSRAESPPESRVRVALTVAAMTVGLPAPVPQFIVLDHDGYFLARVDLAWPDWRFAIEYDGQWHADRQQLSRDRQRIRALNAAGWYVYPVTNDDLRDLDRLVRDVLGLVRRRLTATRR